ncbi:hypothetical protein RZO55_03730 [Clostridium boliviensis]|uniref:DUF4163 domain-containing protein n=1 Tax=Clostridium boliviensis TaxID=318465 RepID=A0ABU4GGF8_9CLOT|nr:hypothetical protein [Clostridium boliviensis]MDW2796688.1 hypothetical protein [Clostridium boliviensis]
MNSLFEKIVSLKFVIILLMLLLLLYRTNSYNNSNNIKESTSLNKQNKNKYISKELNGECELEELKVTSEEAFRKDGLIVYDYHHSIQFNGDNYKKNNYTIRNFLDVDVHYPQVTGLTDKEVETNLNKKLKMLSLNIISADYEEISLKYKSLIDWNINKSNESMLAVNGKYKILSMDNKQISVRVYTDYYEGVNIFNDEYVMTIDINTGNIKKLKDIVDMEYIELAIKNYKYQILSGQTSELDNFMKEQKDEFNKEILAAYKESKKRYANKEWIYGVDRGVANINNFGIDKEYLYINLMYEDALDGFLIIKMPISELKLK